MHRPCTYTQATIVNERSSGHTHLGTTKSILESPLEGIGRLLGVNGSSEVETAAEWTLDEQWPTLGEQWTTFGDPLWTTSKLSVACANTFETTFGASYIRNTVFVTF